MPPSGRPKPIVSIEYELKRYFSCERVGFQTPVKLMGTPFQKQVWSALRAIPQGETRSYSELAIAVANPLGVRAVAQANGANPLPIVIPCHRVIGADGGLGGYAGGIDRKRWLLDHERVLVQDCLSP